MQQLLGSALNSLYSFFCLASVMSLLKQWGLCSCNICIFWISFIPLGIFIVCLQDFSLAYYEAKVWPNELFTTNTLKLGILSSPSINPNSLKLTVFIIHSASGGCWFNLVGILEAVITFTKKVTFSARQLVSLFGCWLDYAETTELVFTKLGRRMLNGSRKNQYNFVYGKHVPNGAYILLL